MFAPSNSEVVVVAVAADGTIGVKARQSYLLPKII